VPPAKGKQKKIGGGEAVKRKEPGEFTEDRHCATKVQDKGGMMIRGSGNNIYERVNGS